jgi:hypothetical protein
LDSLGEEGIGVVVDELAAPPAELDAAEPVLPGVVVSAPGAGEGVGVGAGDAVGALGAGGGVVTVFSSFLQAVRLTATRAARRSERVMLFSFGSRVNRSQRTGSISLPRGEYPVVMTFYQLPSARRLESHDGALRDRAR